jgi:uncharacterized protein YsxB (DUF464 family)
MDAYKLAPIIISILGACFAGYQSYIANIKRKQDIVKAETDRQNAISEAISAVRKHADESLEKTEKHIEFMEANIHEIKTQIANMQTKTDLFWKCIETHLSSLLKSYPSDIEKDVLLTKMAERKLTINEAHQLKEILICEMNIKKSQDKSIIIAYTLAIAGLEQIIYEIEKGQK